MSYTVFALKWRPQDFDNIVGQNHIVTTLKNAIQRNKLAHAYLFAGPRGVGKTSTARILAKALNCKDGPTLNPCGKCPSCVDISQGRSFDVIEIDGASNRGIDEIRVLRENVKFSPTVGKFKIYIIDEVHQITPDGFNALLKTLEEPPPFVKFIFATTHPHKVIPTILSRCQRLDFRRIPVLEIIAQLERIVAQEKIEVDKEVLFAIAKASDGSLRDAESLLDQLSSFSKDKISLRDIVSVLGIVEQDALFEITEKIIHKDAKSALEAFNNIIDEGKDIGVFLSNLIEHFRNLMIAKISKANSKLVDLPQDVCDKLLEQAQNLSLEEIFTAFNILVNAQEFSKRLDSLRIPLEISLVKLAQVKKSLDSQPPLNSHVEREHNQNKNSHSPGELKGPKYIKIDAPTEVKKQEPENSLSFDDIKNTWQSIIDNLGKIKISAATYLSEGKVVKFEKSILTVSFPVNCSLHKESLERKEIKATIEKVVSELLNSDIKINFILSKEAASKEDGGDDAFLKSALTAFKARVIKEN